MRPHAQQAVHNLISWFIVQCTKSASFNTGSLVFPTVDCRSKNYSLDEIYGSAVHRSRRAGAGVLPYFAGAGAGAGVCSPPANCVANFYHRLTKNLLHRRKSKYSPIQLDTNIQIIIMVFYVIFV